MTGPLTPGQITDIVHAAILAAEHEPCRVEVEYGDGRVVRRVDVQLWDDQSHVAGFAVLMHLGDGRVRFEPFDTDPRYGYQVGFCDRVGVDVRVFTLAPPPRVADVEPEAVAAP